MIEFMICVPANIFRIYLMSKFIRMFIGQDGTSYRFGEVLSYGVFFVINTGLYLWLHLSWVNLICNLTGIYFLTCMYSKSIKKKVFVTMSLYVIFMVCDIMGVLLFVSYQDAQSFEQMYQIIVVLMQYICVLIVEEIVSEKQKMNDIQSLALLLIPLSSIVLVCTLFYFFGADKDVVVAVCAGLLIINMIVFYLYNWILKLLIDKYENDVLKQKVEIYAKQIDVILQSEERVKVLKHDLKHHINELKILAQNHKLQDMEEYITNMQSYVQNPHEIVASGNIEIDGVLNYMLQKAKKELHTVDVEVKLPEKILHAFDIVAVLGNLLENAMEASKKTSEKYLQVIIVYKQGVLKCEINNSFLLEDVLEDKNAKGRLITTKENKEIHGIGLNSVRRIVEKYNGLLDMKYEGEVFCTKMLLYLDGTT